MSTTAQAKAARRKARQDKRYQALRSRQRVFKGHFSAKNPAKG